MTEDHLPARRPDPPALSIDRELESAARYAASALASSTRAAYERDWRVFAQWCVARGLGAMPAAPATVAAFLAAEADRAAIKSLEQAAVRGPSTTGRGAPRS
jgi:hypothetical protein